MVRVSDMIETQERGHIDPRGDSFADPDLVDQHCDYIAAIFEQDKDEYAIADDLRAYVAQHLRPNLELYITVNDRLAERNIISKRNFKAYLSLVLET